MSRPVKLAAVQPPPWLPPGSGGSIQAVGIDLFDQAAAAGPDVICLPEYFNCVGCRPDEYGERCGEGAAALLETFAARARANRCYVVLPMIVDESGRRFNRAYVLGRDGGRVGHFDKVHVTEVERMELGVEAGAAWPVFELDFGRAGIMICYDGCFLESARALALAGARVIFWPSLQRSYSRDELELQLRAHAYFNFAILVRSSFGGPLSGEPDAPCMAGLSGVCGDDGGLLAGICARPGWTAAEVDVRRERCGRRTFGGLVGNLRQMRFEDRRPETYGTLSESRPAVR
jgi:predicted amidohydrolase